MAWNHYLLWFLLAQSPIVPSSACNFPSFSSFNPDLLRIGGPHRRAREPLGPKAARDRGDLRARRWQSSSCPPPGWKGCDFCRFLLMEIQKYTTYGGFGVGWECMLVAEPNSANRSFFFCNPKWWYSWIIPTIYGTMVVFANQNHGFHRQS